MYCNVVHMLHCIRDSFVHEPPSPHPPWLLHHPIVLYHLSCHVTNTQSVWQTVRRQWRAVLSTKNIDNSNYSGLFFDYVDCATYYFRLRCPFVAVCWKLLWRCRRVCWKMSELVTFHNRHTRRFGKSRRFWLWPLNRYDVHNDENDENDDERKKNMSRSNNNWMNCRAIGRPRIGNTDDQTQKFNNRSTIYS